MSIPTSRAIEAARIGIDRDKCTGCGLCVQVCKDFGLQIINGKAALADEPMFGCIGCGHCQAVCPAGAITVCGRTLGPEDFFDLPPASTAASFEQFLALLQRRRSVREFTARQVEPELTQKILTAARSAPMGLPPSDVKVLLLDGAEKNRAFARDFCAYLKDIRWLTAPWFLTLMRPFWGKDNDLLFRNFIGPALNSFIDYMDRGENIVTYDAPLAMYFYASPLADPADPVVAATYAMLAGHSLGLGTCMIGSIHPLLQFGGKAKTFRQSHGIANKSSQGLFVLFGYPAVSYRLGINRSFAAEDGLFC